MQYIARLTTLSGIACFFPDLSHNHARGLKMWIKIEEELYYLKCLKGADQLCSYCTADLCLCFSISRLLLILLLFSGAAHHFLVYKQILTCVL